MIQIIKHCVLLLSLLLWGCANPTRDNLSNNTWPSDIPEKSYYQTLYSSDSYNQQTQTEDDYLTWIVRFYKGWAGFTRGWLDASDELTASVDQSRQQVVSDKLAALGKEVSGEWAKKSDQRLIYTKTLSIWGNALSESIYQERVEPVVDMITADVNLMMSKQLQAEAITLQRYFPNLDFEQEFSMF